MYSMSQKIHPPLRFSGNISPMSENFNEHFTCLMYVYIYAKLQNFIWLSLWHYVVLNTIKHSF